MNSIVVSAFPGTGKTHLYNNRKCNIIDSDSSMFDKRYFPQNYIEHIKFNINLQGIILVSSHKIVRDALVQNDIFFYLVYPDINLKHEYLSRYKKRNSPQEFIDLISKNWEAWINECKNQNGCEHIVLESDKFVSDIIEDI